MRSTTADRAKEVARIKSTLAIRTLEADFVPPGILRREGPRHANDHSSITRISVMPSHSELVDKTLPYLPSNLLGAPHHHEPGSMERHLDTHFRLCREVRV